jgi:hypothetical protein
MKQKLNSTFDKNSQILSYQFDSAITQNNWWAKRTDWHTLIIISCNYILIEWKAVTQYLPTSNYNPSIPVIINLVYAKTSYGVCKIKKIYIYLTLKNQDQI